MTPDPFVFLEQRFDLPHIRFSREPLVLPRKGLRRVIDGFENLVADGERISLLRFCLHRVSPVVGLLN